VEKIYTTLQLRHNSKIKKYFLYSERHIGYLGIVLLIFFYQK